MLEALAVCLKSYFEAMEIAPDDRDAKLVKLGESVCIVLTELISGNGQNATVFRESEGVTITLGLAKLPASRPQAINLLQQLVLASGSEEDMTVLLELLQSSPPTDYAARIAFVHAVISCLRESHRCRAIFR
jgi:hypothetical protein